MTTVVVVDINLALGSGREYELAYSMIAGIQSGNRVPRRHTQAVLALNTPVPRAGQVLQFMAVSSPTHKSLLLNTLPSLGIH